jgi:hypothetical protein
MRPIARFLAIAAMLQATAFAGEATFASKPSVTKADGKTRIAFAVAASTDVEVSILDAKGKVIRHLAAGVLGGKNAPPAPLETGLRQELEWDGKTDTGMKASGGGFKVRVRLGLGVELDGFIGEQTYHIAHGMGMATDEAGNVYVYSASTGNKAAGGTPYLLKYDRGGNYIKTLMPMPANLPRERAAKLGLVSVPGDDHLFPKSLAGTWPILGFKPGALFHRVSSKGELTFFDWLNVRRLGPDGGPADSSFARPVWDKRPARGIWRYKMVRSPCIAVDSQGEYVYMAGLRDKKAKAGKGSFPGGRIYRMKLAGGKREKFADIEGAAGTGNMDFDAKGNLLVCTPGKVVVLSPAGKKLGEFACPTPSRLACDRKTGAVYVLSQGRRKGNWRAPKSILKFEDWKSGKQVATLDLGLRGAFAFMALDATAPKPIVWVLINRTGGSSPYNPGAHAKLLRLEDSGGKFVDTPHKIDFKRRPFGVITRLAVHPENDKVVCRSEFSLAAGYEGLTGKRLKLPFSHAPDMAVGLDGNWYITPGNMWMGPIGRYDPDLKPIPTPGQSAGSKRSLINKAGFAFGRYGAGFGVGGLAADATGRVYTLQQFNQHTVAGDLAVIFDPVGKAEDHGRMKGDPRITKKHKQFESGIFGPIATVVGDIAVDWKGNMYMALRTLPAGHKPPPGYAADPGYWHCTGTILKIPPSGGSLFNLGGKGSRPPQKERKVPAGMKGISMEIKNRYPRGKQFCEGAVKAYPGIGVMGGGYGGGCRCRQPMFELDGWGRLFVPNATIYHVRVLDNAGNEILKFGHYGNADSRGEKEGSPITTPAIPLGWPEAVGASNKAVYVADVLNRRIVRLKKTYQAEETVDVK